MTSLVVFLSFAVSLLAPMAAQQPSPDVVPQARAILGAIAAGDFTQIEKQFTDDMKTALPTGALAARWTQLLNQAGGYKRCGTDPRVRTIDDKRMVITPCEFERMTIDIQFAFDRAGRVSGLVFRPGARTTVAYTLPSYANASSFVEREMAFGPSEWSLPATLTVPVGVGPWPAVVLVHGSGPNDRDETVGAFALGVLVFYGVSRVVLFEDGRQIFDGREFPDERLQSVRNHAHCALPEPRPARS